MQIQFQANVENNSPTVEGVNTTFTQDVEAGQAFAVVGDNVTYTVASVDSNTQITLSAPYQGSTVSGAQALVVTDYTNNYSLPEIARGDLESGAIYTRAVRRIDDVLGEVKSDVDNLQDNYASESDAREGENNTRFMTPLRTRQSTEEQLLDEYNLRKELSVEPTLSCDFRKGEYKLYDVQEGYRSVGLNDIWDVTRASGETVLTPAGRIATVDPDTLPLTYVPETGGLGAQVVGSYTNLLLWSEDLTQGQWSKGDRVTVESDAGSGYKPDAINLVVPTSEDNRSYLSQIFTTLNSIGVNVSGFFKAAGYDFVNVLTTGLDGEGNRATINLQTGETLNSGDAVSKSVKLSGGWYWFSVFMPSSSPSNGSVQISIVDSFTHSLDPLTGDGTSGVYMWGIQITEGPTLLPYLKTEASTVTKPATNVVRELGEEFNRGEFTLLVDITPLEVTGVFFGVADSFSDTAYVSSNGISIRSGGNTIFNRSYSSEAGRRDRLAVRVKSGDHAIVINSSIQASEATGVPESLVRMRVGGAPWLTSQPGDASLVVHHIECIPRALSDAEILEWTRPRE